jgi:sarcosine oxidase subunit gamma
MRQLDVRVRPHDADRGAGISDRLGVPLPLEPNTHVATADGARRVAWLGPDEWLVLDTAPEDDPDLEADLGPLVAGAGAVIDVSHGRAGLALAGPGARELLEHGCPIDLHPRSFVPGRAAQTELALAHALLLAIDDAPTVQVLVRPSFAGYLADWLTDAARDPG